MMGINGWTEAFGTASVTALAEAKAETNTAPQDEQTFADLLAASYLCAPPSAAPVNVSTPPDACASKADVMTRKADVMTREVRPEVISGTVSEVVSETVKAVSVPLELRSAEAPETSSYVAADAEMPLRATDVLAEQSRTEQATERQIEAPRELFPARPAAPFVLPVGTTEESLPPVNRLPTTPSYFVPSNPDEIQPQVAAVRGPTTNSDTAFAPLPAASLLQPEDITKNVADTANNIGTANIPEPLSRGKVPRAARDSDALDRILPPALPASDVVRVAENSPSLPAAHSRMPATVSFVAAESFVSESGEVASTETAPPVNASSAQTVFVRDFSVVPVLPTPATVMPSASAAVTLVFPSEQPTQALPLFGTETVRVAAQVIKSLAIEPSRETEVSAPLASISFVAATPSPTVAPASSPVSASAASATNDSVPLLFAKPSAVPVNNAAPVVKEPPTAPSIPDVAAVDVRNEEHLAAETMPGSASTQTVASAWERNPVQTASLPRAVVPPLATTAFVPRAASPELQSLTMPSREAALDEWLEHTPTTDAEAGPSCLPVNTTSQIQAPAGNVRAAAPPLVQQTVPAMLELVHATPPRETHALRLQLQPEELGRVEIEITRAADGRVSASLAAEQFDAATTLTQSLGHLRESLEQAGLVIERLEVVATPQFQNNTNGQAQSQSQPQHSDPTVQLPLQGSSEDSTAAEEEEKLLNLRA